MTPIRVAAVRLAPVPGGAVLNRRTIEELVERAAGLGARLVVLPELASTAYYLDDARAVAEPIDGPTTRAWTGLAGRLGLVIVAGLCELGGNGALHNTAVVVDGSGVLGRYRKLHLWNGELDRFVAGSEPPPVVESAVGRIGLAICYDLWFPELARDLASRGAEILVYPSTFAAVAAPEGLPPLAVVCAVAAAHQNRVHAVVADRCGAEEGRAFAGTLAIARADGTLVSAPNGSEPEIVVADLDPADARDKSWGSRNDLFADRRLPLL